MTLLIDKIDGTLRTLTGQGWVISGWSRYDPSIFTGNTPTGRSFTMDANPTTGIVRLTIANRTQTQNVSREAIEDAVQFEGVWNATYLQFPPNQR